MNLWFIMGTAAELIKVFPVIYEAQARGLSWYVWSTGQGSTNFWMQYDDLRLPRERAFCLDDQAQDLNSSAQAMHWMARNLFRSKSSMIREIRNRIKVTPSAGDLAIVHGDTFSTFVGARYAKRLQMKLLHIEAGMRSGDLFNPFPEEINRRLVSRWTDIHFAPEETNKEHLVREGRSGEIIVTGGNSVYDSMLSTLKLARPSDLPTGRYILANLHRFENLHNLQRWNAMVEALLEAQNIAPVYFVMHPPTESRLKQDPGALAQLTAAGVHLLPRQSYTRFVHLLAGAHFVLTDGGSNQTECAYLGLPCLVMREKTELTDGLGQNCLLSEFSKERLRNFLNNSAVYKRDVLKLPESPCEKIMQVLLREVK